MNHKPINPNVVATIFFITAAVVLLFLPFSIQVVPNTTDAQAGQPSAQTVAQQPQIREYTLRTEIGGEPLMKFVGVGGDIDGVVNPTLTANVGDELIINIINGARMLHDFKIDAFNVNSGEIIEADEVKTVNFVVTQPGDFEYYCSITGHKEAGMLGLLRVTGEVEVGDRTELAASQGDGYVGGESAQAETMDHTVTSVAAPAPAAADAVSIVRSPADVPPPVGDRGPMTLRVDMETVEVTGFLADGTTFNYFTFDGKVPGPMLRVRVGDTVEFFLNNDETSLFPHSIDLHAVTGPGGGAVYTQTVPGGQTSFVFQALNPGLYVYHCATSSIPHHISSGMYGLILVEPPGGLPPVDREFYVMQGDIYTSHEFGTAGHMDFDMEAMRDEDATYLVFNGAVGGLTSDENALRANVGETVRIFFGVGGPNYTSSFHVIGEIFDRVYPEGAMGSEPMTNVQTTLVPTGGATIVEFKVEVPGRYILVDHSLSRLERGLAGYLIVEGEDNPDVYHSDTMAEASGH